MTVITVKMTKPIEIFHFNPPLPPAKKIEILNFGCVGPFSRKIILEIVDPFSHFSNLGRDKIEPTRLVAYAGCFSVRIDSRWKRLFCPEKFPMIKAQKSKDPINSIKINIESILDPSRIPSFFNVCSVCLKIYH